MSVKGCFITLSIFFILTTQAYPQTSTSIRDWPMPAGDERGLVAPGFKLVPRFELLKLGEELHVILKLDVAMGTAQNPVGPFSYRYMYHGKIYTDQDLGPQPFYPIKLARAVFSVRVQGSNNYSKQVAYNSVIAYLDLGMFSKSTKAEEFTASIQGLSEVSYHGTETIERAINNMESAAKLKAVDDAKAVSQKQIVYEKSQGTGQSRLNVNPQKTIDSAPKQGNTAAKGDNSFWTEQQAQPSSEPGKLIPEQPIHKTLPDFVRTTDGGYFHRGADGRFRQLTAEEYTLAKKNVSHPVATQTEVPKMSSEAIRGRINLMFANEQARNDAVTQKIERTADAWRQNFYYAEAIRTGKENLAALSTLNGDYNSVQELEADFNQQYNSIRAEVNNLEQARNAQLANATSNNFNGSSTEQAVGQGVQLIGGLVNSLKADKEAKEAREALKAERARQLALLEERKKKARIDMRNKLTQNFPDGGTPLTSHKVTVPEVYMFAYIIDKAAFNNQQATISVSNVFPVAQYSDGTYPYKTTVTNKLKGYAPGDIVLIGYYSEKDRAEQMRNSFVNLAAKSELSVKSFALKPVTGSSASGQSATSGDFWETGNKKPSEKKSDFWNN